MMPASNAEVDLHILDEICASQYIDSTLDVKYQVLGVTGSSESVLGVTESSESVLGVTLWSESAPDIIESALRAAEETSDVDMALPTVLGSNLQESEGESRGNDEGEGETSILPTTIDDSKLLEESSVFQSFWVYKRFPRGPKSRTLDLTVKTPTNPHRPIKFVDPVFSETINRRQSIVSSGAMRLGEGNDISPSPGKMLRLQKEILETTEKLSTNKSDSLGKRGKLSSRLSRLKKSANHEANKIIFHGLEEEKDQLSGIVNSIKKVLRNLNLPTSCKTFHRFFCQHLKLHTTKVAGRRGAYVDEILSMEQEVILYKQSEDN